MRGPVPQTSTEGQYNYPCVVDSPRFYRIPSVKSAPRTTPPVLYRQTPLTVNLFPCPLLGQRRQLLNRHFHTITVQLIVVLTSQPAVINTVVSLQQPRLRFIHLNSNRLTLFVDLPNFDPFVCCLIFGQHTNSIGLSNIIQQLI